MPIRVVCAQKGVSLVQSVGDTLGRTGKKKKKNVSLCERSSPLADRNQVEMMVERFFFPGGEKKTERAEAPRFG